MPEDTTMTDLSAELRAMAQIEAALKDLADDERARVMQWASSRFRLSAKAAAKAGGGTLEADGEGADLGKYSTLAELYDAATPSTDKDRALVAAYWFQFGEHATEIEAMKVNTQLKHLGHGVNNITRVFGALKSHKPALIMQIRKEGTTKQARKKYRITAEGKKAVERLLAGGEEG